MLVGEKNPPSSFIQGLPNLKVTDQLSVFNSAKSIQIITICPRLHLSVHGWHTDNSCRV